MKIGKVSVKNFQSYREIDFDYSDLGLTLISGETGSGKSTFMDAVAWTIFGITSKESAADDVRAWDASGPTQGIARVVTPTGEIVIYRRRGLGNDLHWTDVVGGKVDENKAHRGKDLVDTQRLLEARLGVTAELFLTGSYLTQFSKADSFFIAKAKDRRETLEQIADQEFAIKLGDRCSEARKVTKKDLEILTIQEARESGKVQALQNSIFLTQVDLGNWIDRQMAKVSSLREKFETFDQDKARTVAAIKTKSAEWRAAQSWGINDLTNQKGKLPTPVPTSAFAEALADLDKDLVAIKTQKCSACGNFDGVGLECLRSDREVLRQDQHSNNVLMDRHQALRRQIKALKDASDPHLSGLQQVQSQLNPYGEQILAAKAEVNPYVKRLAEANAAFLSASDQVKVLRDQVEGKNALIAQLTWLYDKSFELRALLMARVVSQIESSTNDYLERFFDAALRVKFSLADSDKLEVEILNQGYSAPFKALSGGERCMLKLAFSLSLMKAAQDKAGVQFGAIFLDEAFNGLDANLKVKSFRLLQELAQQYETVMVIDHSEELKSQFSKVFVVAKTSGNSVVYEQ